MGRLIFPLALIFILLSPALFPQADPEWSMPGDKIEETEGQGLVVRSSPSSALVYVDGIERGSTPLRLGGLRPGQYNVRVKKDGYEDRSFRVSVRPGSAIDVSLNLKEAVGRVSLKIMTDSGGPPPECAIGVDGVPFQGPELELPEGFRTILIRSFGWDDVSETLFVERNSRKELEVTLRPSPFGISRAGQSRLRFNPANSGSLGSTSVYFEVSGPGRGFFAVIDKDGNTVHSRSLGPFLNRAQSVEWDGRSDGGSILDDGIYSLLIYAAPDSAPDSAPLDSESLSFTVALDSGAMIYPLTSVSGKSGLMFAPFPASLPRGSFQVEGSLIAGKAPGAAAAWKSLPFAVSFRISPVDRLEASAALNVTPSFEGDSGAGAGAGARWVYLKKPGLPIAAAAGLNFSWTGKAGLSPFGMASGIEASFPLMLEAGRIFSFAFSPAALWTGDKGFPWEGAPRLLLSGGIFARMAHASAGLSARAEFGFAGGRPPPRVMGAAEVKIFPPPSSFAFTLMGGFWVRGDGSAKDSGGFGGLGIGIIH